MKFFGVLFSVFIALFLTGCGTQESDKVKTKDIYVQANATVGSDTFKYNNISVRMYEKDGLKRSVELVGDEYLTVSYNNQIVKLKGRTGYSGPWYETLFPYDGKTGVLTVTFHRNDGTTIPMSVEMVEPFNVTSPSALTEYEEYETIPLRWEVPTSLSQHFNVQVKLGSPSLNVSSNEIMALTDNGYHEFVLSKLADNLRKDAEKKGLKLDMAESCWMNLKLSRYNEKSLSGGFSNSSYIRVSFDKEITDLKMMLSSN